MLTPMIQASLERNIGSSQALARKAARHLCLSPRRCRLCGLAIEPDYVAETRLHRAVCHLFSSPHDVPKFKHPEQVKEREMLLASRPVYKLQVAQVKSLKLDS